MFRCYLFVPPWLLGWPSNLMPPHTCYLQSNLFPVLILLCSELSLLLPLSVKEGLIVLHVLNKLHHVVVASRCIISRWMDIFPWYDGMWIEKSYHYDVFIIPANGVQMICKSFEVEEKVPQAKRLLLAIGTNFGDASVTLRATRVGRCKHATPWSSCHKYDQLINMYCIWKKHIEILYI